MDKKSNKFIAVSYQLFTTNDEGKKEMIEEATAEQPYQFISGLGFTLPGFEKAVEELSANDTFQFTLPKEEAYGEYLEERVLDLEKSVFSINGHFDHDNVYKDAIIPLQNEDGNRFQGHVLEVGDDTVTIDLNHPLAGMDLEFCGTVIESRDATNEEIERLVKMMSGEGCGCGCDDCDHDHCGHAEEPHPDHCGCGHCH